MARPIPLQRFAGILGALAMVCALSAPARAIDGGGLAGRTRLTEATVGIGTLTASEDRVGLSRCSGVLIAPQLVLTAGHCVRNNPVASVVVLYNGPRPSGPAIRVAELTRYEVDTGDLPADYADMVSLSLDTAVLRLASPVRNRVPLPISRGGTPPAGMRVAGAGLSAQGVGVLKTTRLTPILMTATGLIVARTHGAEVCKGDSGGPVVADGPRGPVLWGVTSAVLARPGEMCGPIVLIAPASPRI